MPRKTHRTLAAGLCLLLAAATVWADPQPPAAHQVQLDIPASSVEEALKAFARQAGVQVLFYSATVDRLKAPRLSGQFTAEAALNTLLAGTGLRHEFINERTVAIREAKLQEAQKPVLSNPQGHAEAQDSGPMRLALAQAEVTQQATAEAPLDVEKGIPEMLVKGARRSVNADIQRTEDDVQPYVVYTAEEIQSSMASNLEEFFKMRLPMATVLRQNNGTGTNSQSRTSGSNQSAINLRGLGTDETLVLVNGRRMPGVSALFDSDSDAIGAINQPDINGIPLSQIERIEVLPSTAGGIYGGGATGGVINVILKNDYTGVEASVNYANLFDTDAGNVQMSATGGFSLEGGRTNITLSASYSDANSMLVRDRDLVQRARGLAVQADRASFINSYNLPLGYTTNIRSAEYTDDYSDFQPLVFRDGTPLGAKTTSVPVGYRGIALDGRQGLIDGAGDLNLDLSNDLNGGGGSQLNSPKTHSVRFNVSREFSDRFSMFFDASQNENQGRVTFAGGVQNQLRLPAFREGPFQQPILDADGNKIPVASNPFLQAVDVIFPLPGLAFETSNSSKSTTGVLGASYRLPWNWNAQLEYTRGRSTNTTVGGTPFRTGAIADALANGALDVLRDLNIDPLDLTPYALPGYPNGNSGPAELNMSGGVLRLSGPILKLPGGSMTLSTALERNKQSLNEALQQIYNEGLGGNRWFYEPARSSVSDSVYIETFVPLVSAVNARPFLKLLEFQASGRSDKYTQTQGRISDITIVDNGLPAPSPLPDVYFTDSSVKSTGYTLGFRYAPLEDVVLRASYSYGFKPPSVAQISPIHAVGYRKAISDPRRDFEYYQADVVIQGGNPDLQPETSDSVSAGIIFTPGVLPGLRLSVDYTQIKKKGEISFLTASEIMDNPELYPGRIVRDGTRDAGDPPEFENRVSFIDSSMININLSQVVSYDFQADYGFTTDAGNFNLYLLGTKAVEFSRKYTDADVLTNAVDFLDGPLDWTGNAGATWKHGAWTLGWNMQYYDSYRVYGSREGAFTDILGSSSIPSQHYHDVSFGYRFGEAPGFGRFLANTQISGGVQNVFDTIPPPFLVSGTTVGYSAYGDARLRRYTLQLTKSF